MPVSPQFHVRLRFAAALGLVCLCAGAAPERPIFAPQPASLAPVVRPSPDTLIQALPHERGQLARAPFGLSPALNGATVDKWRRLQSVLRVEAQLLARCSSEPQLCPPHAARFLAIVEAGRARGGRTRIGEINRAVNLAIRSMSDHAQFGVADVWSTPLMTFSAGAGDCEDYAIAKLVALRESGIDAENLRLIIVHDRQSHEDHAVAAVRDSADWLILDNRQFHMATDTQTGDVVPLMSLAMEDESPLTTAAATIAGAAIAQLDADRR